MAFKLTDQKIHPEEKVEGWTILQRELRDFQRTVNLQPWYKRMWYDYLPLRVFYTVLEPRIPYDSKTNDKTLEVIVYFNKQDRIDDPESFGDRFREECINYALNKANDYIESDIARLLISVKEEPDRKSLFKSNLIEERLYEQDKA